MLDVDIEAIETVLFELAADDAGHFGDICLNGPKLKLPQIFLIVFTRLLTRFEEVVYECQLNVERKLNAGHYQVHIEDRLCPSDGGYLRAESGRHFKQKLLSEQNIAFHIFSISKRKTTVVS